MSATDNTPSRTPATGDATGPKKRTIFAWSLWDWGSAAFNAVVTTFVFSVYITSASFGPDEDVLTSRLGVALFVAGVIVFLFAPIIGRLTDQAGRRRLWLIINTNVVVACTALLVFVAPAEQFFLLGLVLLAIGNVGFEFASVNYNATLKQISHSGNVGKISGFGWGMGYIGGIVLLAILLVGFIFPDVGWFGVTAEDGWNVRIAMLVSAAWFGLFAIPTYFSIDEVPAAPGARKPSIIDAYRDLFASIADLWRNARHTLHFLIASAVFRDGLAGVFTFGGVIAARSFGFDSTTVIIFAIAANVVAGAATIVLGALEDRVGAKRIMVTSLILMVVFGLLVFILAPRGTWIFWVFGLALCVFVGPVQSASRAFLARLIPPGREGEIFGLYATTGRAVSFLAPGAFAVTVAIGGSTIFGILGVVAVLLLGLLLLAFVRVPQLTPSDG